MRDRRKKAFSLFLSAMMTLSLVPTAAFAAEPDNVLFDVTNELTDGGDGGDFYHVKQGDENTTFGFKLGFTGVNDVDTYAAIIDYSSISAGLTYSSGYVPNGITTQLGVGGQSWSPTTAKLHFGPGEIEGATLGQDSLVMYYTGGETLIDDANAGSISFSVNVGDGVLEPGVYPISVTVYQLNDSTGKLIAVGDASQHQTKTVEFRVADANGDVPDGTEEAKVTVQAGTQDNATLSELPTEAVGPGDKFTVKVTPAEGYTPEADDVTVVGVDGATVSDFKDNGDGTYSYTVTLPDTIPEDATLTVNVSVAAAPVQDTFGIKTSVTSGANTGEISVAAEAKAGDTVTVTMKPQMGYTVANKPVVTKDDGSGTVEVSEGTPSGDSMQYTFVMPNGAVTVSGAFQAVSGTCQIAMGTVVNCEVDTNGVTSVNPGDTFVFYVTPEQGYDMGEDSSVQVVAEGAVSNPQVTKEYNGDGRYKYTLTVPEGSTKLTIGAIAVLGTTPPVVDTYKVNVVVNEESETGTDYGSVSFEGGQTEYAEGATVKFTVHPNQGFELTGTENIRVVGNGSLSVTAVLGEPDTYQFTMPAQAVTVYVDFTAIEDDNENQYEIKLPEVPGGRVWLQDGHSGYADEGETVRVYIDADDGYVLDTIRAYKCDEGGTVTGNYLELLNGGVQDDVESGYQYIEFKMPASSVSVNATFVEEDETGTDTDPTVPEQKVEVRGKVVSQYNKPIEDAVVKIASNSEGFAATQYKATVGADGTFAIQVPAGSNYVIRAQYDPKVFEGAVSAFSELNYSQTANLLLSGIEGNVSSGHTLTIDLHYDWDVDNDGNVESIYPGENHKFLDTETPDYYKETIGGREVLVYADDEGNINSTDAYYYWDVDDDNVNEKVFIGNDFKSGTFNDNYIANITFLNPILPDNADGTKNVTVFIGKDNTPGTSDDYYDQYDVNNDGVNDTVFAGNDGIIGTEDDWYKMSDGTVIYVGDDKIPGSYDDYYYEDCDGDGEDEKVWVGDPDETNPDRDRLPHTSDDNYVEDVNSDGEDEHIFAGEDGTWNTGDDFYRDEVGSQDVIVYPGETGDVEDPFDFGTPTDHYDYDIDPTDGEDIVTVYVGEDTQAGTDDDWFEYNVPTPGQETDENGIVGGGATDMTEVPVDVGEDGIPGTSDDTYQLDADMDGEDETVHVGNDGKPGTNDDWYEDDVNGDEKPERVQVGDDGIFGTDDDHYDAVVNTPDDTQEKVPVYAGEDGKFSPADDPDNDDWYPWDTDKDGDTNPDIYDGENHDDKVFIDGDSFPGTDDDYYYDDVDNDGDKDDVVHVGDDGIPGTEDDWYDSGVDVDGDGDNEKVHPGEDGDFGTPDDWYEADVDDDGKDEVVYVGEDTKPGTEDDWYYADITFNAAPGTVNGSSTWTVLTSELTALPTASRSGSYSFVGWSLSSGSGSVLTLEQVKDIKTDTVLYAYYRYTGSTGGGGSSGGGGGGGSSVSTYTVRFDSNGGSAVANQQVSRNGTVDEPRDPTREGYKFTGWYVDDDCTELYDFDSKVTKSFTLYAGWEEGETVSDRVFRYLTDEHISYIAGFGDGLVHGDENMTRAQVATVFYRLLNDETRARYSTSVNNFTDVSSSAWYNTAVSTLSNMGIVAGYGNGEFGPDDSITRAQFATICARIGELEANGTNHFVDVPSDFWAYDFINAAADQGWVAGYGNGYFGPNDTITRSQVVVILNRVLERDELTLDSFADFGDEIFNWPDNNDPTAWDYLPLIEAGNSHDFERDSNGEEIWTALN